MNDFSPPRVDGIVTSQVDIDAVLRLDRMGLSAHAIAENLGVTVLDVEYVLRRSQIAKALRDRMAR
jgi:hypothetical protein